MPNHFFSPKTHQNNKINAKLLVTNCFYLQTAIHAVLEAWQQVNEVWVFNNGDKTDPEKQQSCQAVISNRQHNETYNRGQLRINEQ